MRSNHRTHFIHIRLGLFLILCVMVASALAQPAKLDAGFNPGQGANMQIYTTVLQPDGKILIGGSFTTFHTTARKHVARLHTDGSVDMSFNPGVGPNSVIRSCAVQPDGKLVIVGGFTTFQNMPRNSIARLHWDGNLDTGFDPGSGANAMIDFTILQPDGKILIGGSFNQYNGASRSAIARLHADGSVDTTFNPGTGADGTVLTMALQPDGKILIAGSFTMYNGVSRNSIARVLPNGALDTTFKPGTGVDNGIRTMCIQPDGKIVFGGNFTTYNGTTQGRFTRVLADGSLDPSFQSGTAADWDVFTADLQADNKIILGGNFTSYNGTPRRRIARLHSDGSVDTSFNPGIGFDNVVICAKLQPDSAILLAGVFTDYNGTPRNSIVRLEGGEAWPVAVAEVSGTEPFTNLYPNPTSDLLNMAFYGKQNREATVQVLDYGGRMVHTRRVNTRSGLNSLQIDLSKLASGSYTVQLLADQQVMYSGKVAVRH